MNILASVTHADNHRGLRGFLRGVYPLVASGGTKTVISKPKIETQRVTISTDNKSKTMTFKNKAKMVGRVCKGGFHVEWYFL